MYKHSVYWPGIDEGFKPETDERWSLLFRWMGGGRKYCTVTHRNVSGAAYERVSF